MLVSQLSIQEKGDLMNEDVKVVEELIDLYNKKGFNHTGSINLVEPNTLYFTKNSNIINEKIRNVKSRIRSTKRWSSVK